MNSWKPVLLRLHLHWVLLVILVRKTDYDSLALRKSTYLFSAMSVKESLLVAFSSAFPYIRYLWSGTYCVYGSPV